MVKSFQDITQELSKLASADDYNFLQEWVQDLPLDEEQFVLSAMEDMRELGNINRQVSTTEKLRIVAALWAGFKADKYMENTDIGSLSDSEVYYFDVIRKRESAALNQMADLRNDGGSGKALEDIMDDFQEAAEQGDAVPENEKFEID